MSKDKKLALNGSIEKIAGGSGLIAIGMLFSKAFEYIYKMIVSRIGVEEFGVLSLGLAVFGFVSAISYMGIPHGIRRYIPFMRGANDVKALASIMNFAMRITAVSSVVMALIGMLCARPIAIQFLHNEKYAYLMIILFAALPFYSLKDILVKILLAFEKVKYRIYAYNIIEPGSKVIFTSLLICLGFGITGVFVSYTLATIAVFCVSLFLVEFKTFPFIRSINDKAFALSREFFLFSIGLVLSDFLVFIMLWTDTILIGFFRGPHDVGIYNAGMTIASLIIILPQLIMPISTPVIISTFSRSGEDDAKQLFNITTKWVCVAVLPCIIFLILFGKEVLGLVFGSNYISGSAVILMLLVGKFLYVVTWMSNEILMMLKKTTIIFAASFTSTVINVALNLLLIPKFGIVGSAVATSISLSIQAIATTYFCHRYFRASILNWGIGLIVAINCVAGLILNYAWQLGLKNTKLMFIVYILFYAFILYYLRVANEDDKIFLAALFKKIKSILFLKKQAEAV